MGVFCTRQVQMGDVKNTHQKSYDICSTQELLLKELRYIEKVFGVDNNYLNWAIKKALQQAKQK